MNKNQKRWGFALLLVLQELWTYQGFFLVTFKLYTFDSWFNYNHWVKVLLISLVRVSLINVGSGFSIKIWILAFLVKYSNIFVGSQSMSIEVRNIFQYFCWVSKRVYWGSHHTLNDFSLIQTLESQNVTIKRTSGTHIIVKPQWSKLFV